MSAMSNFLPAETNPAMVITTDNPEVSLGAVYRGQDFILSENADWSLVRPLDWFRWLVTRSIPSPGCYSRAGDPVGENGYLSLARKW
jgi:hypothetical protein